MNANVELAAEVEEEDEKQNAGVNLDQIDLPKVPVVSIGEAAQDAQAVTRRLV